MRFGETLRAHRLCWGQLPAPAEGLMRLTPLDGGRSLCELRPLGLVPGELDKGELHAVWWEQGGGLALVEASPYLRAVGRVEEYTSVVLDERGEVVA